MARRRDYRYMSGIIGNYGNNDVWAIPEKDFTVELSKEHTEYIYAVTNFKEDKIKLVNRGMIIGYMSPEGDIELLDASEFYIKPAITVEAKGGKNNIPEVIVEATSASGKTIDDYLAGETLADRFLRQFGQW